MSTRAPEVAPFDFLSYARRGPGRRDRLSKTQIAEIARTVHRTPEVMVKVLSKGATSVAAVGKHLDYIDRDGKVDLETDEGRTLRGTDVAEDLLEDWDLELDEGRRQSDLRAGVDRDPPRLVHKVIFSMPAGTPADKVLTAVRDFCREEFAFKHRYVMALHTDEPHPHVHVVIKAVNEQGQRLNIRKATLQEWRWKFASQLREVGVPANATPRFMRGETKPRNSDGIYRASLRGQSTHLRERAEAVALELVKGELQIESAKAKLLSTRMQVEHAWRGVSDILTNQGQRDLAGQVRRFADQMRPPQSEKEWLAEQIRSHATREPMKEHGVAR